MTCRDVEALLDAYADRELDPPKTRLVRTHLAACAACTGRLERIDALRVAIRRHLPAHPAPDVLRARIRRAVREEAARVPARRAIPWRWLAVAAVSIALVGGYGVTARERQSADAAVARDVVESHVRSLLPGHLTDVASSDEHSVKPWFEGRLDYSPDVYDLAAQGFELVGGRLDVVGGRKVAALVYTMGRHVINVFLWPASGETASSPAGSVNGYHMVRWTGDGMTCWVVSDASQTELERFARAWASADEHSEEGEERGATPPAPGAPAEPAR